MGYIASVGSVTIESLACLALTWLHMCRVYVYGVCTYIHYLIEAIDIPWSMYVNPDKKETVSPSRRRTVLDGPLVPAHSTTSSRI